MRRIPIDQFVQIGLTLRFFTGLSTGTPINGAGSILARTTLLESQLTAAKCRVTKALCATLFETVKNLHAEAGPSFLDDATAARLRDMAASAERTLLAEASQLSVFAAADTRWSTEDLFDNVSRLLGNGVFETLKPLSQRDLAESAKCLVCERPTASAFHVLRATEGQLREFYKARVRRNRIPEPRLWGPIVAHLRTVGRPPPVELLNNLDHIRTSFRNPTQHPEAEYTLDRAQDLFALCAEAISRMSAHADH